MIVAIMQPYYYPYVGYFELIKAVDKFVFLNDVQYIRRGWINRNRIKWNKEWKYLTVPVKKCDRSTLIKDIKISNQEWKAKHISSLTYSYKNILDHPCFQYLEKINTLSLCDLLIHTVEHTARFLGIKTEFLNSCDYSNKQKKQGLIIDMCKQLGAKTYINAVGGQHLYSKEEFEDNGITLEFMKPTNNPNKLSILDLIFNDNIKEI